MRCPCPYGLCDGSGFLIDDGTRTASDCRCRRERIQQRRLKAISRSLPARFQHLAWDRAPISQLDRRNLKAARAWLRNLGHNIAEGKGLWIAGDVGTGKTSLAMLIAKEVQQAGYTVSIYRSEGLFSAIRATYDSATTTYSEFVEQISAVDLLFIDDFGAEQQREWVLHQLDYILGIRWDEQKPLLITTNLLPDDLRTALPGRVFSRLWSLCGGEPLRFSGEDHRR
jgi:DNA replication protein DnaC